MNEIIFRRVSIQNQSIALEFHAVTIDQADVLTALCKIGAIFIFRIEYTVT